MAVTTTTLLPSPVQQSFDYKLLSFKQPNLIHKIAADTRKMPANGGNTLRMRRYNKLNTAPVPLGNTGVAPAGQSLSAVDIDAEMSFYGDFITLNEQVNA
jgi:N4-gp56 family major capsid protein